MATSTGPRRRSVSARRSIFAVRALVALTASEVAVSSASSTNASCQRRRAYRNGTDAECDAIVRPPARRAPRVHRVGHLLPARVVEVLARGAGADAAHVRAVVVGDAVRGLARAARQPA